MIIKGKLSGKLLHVIDGDKENTTLVVDVKGEAFYIDYDPTDFVEATTDEQLKFYEYSAEYAQMKAKEVAEETATLNIDFIRMHHNYDFEPDSVMVDIVQYSLIRCYTFMLSRIAHLYRANPDLINQTKDHVLFWDDESNSIMVDVESQCTFTPLFGLVMCEEVAMDFIQTSGVCAKVNNYFRKVKAYD